MKHPGKWYLSLLTLLLTIPVLSLAQSELPLNIDLHNLKYDITRVHVILTHESGIVRETDLKIDRERNMAYGLITGLEVGTWRVEVELYAGRVIVGKGEGTMKVESGKVTEVHIKVNFNLGSAKIFVEWGKKVADEIINRYFRKSKLVLRIETGAEFDFNGILSDSNLNAVEIEKGAYWDFDLKYPLPNWQHVAGFPEITIRVLVTRDGDLYVGPISGSAEDQLKLLVFGGPGNYRNFDGSLLKQSVYRDPKGYWLECTIRQNYLSQMAYWSHWRGDDKGYRYLYNHGYVRKGPSNTYELFNRRIYLYNMFGDKITVIFSGIFHEQFDYSWYNELWRPIHEAINRKWSPIANNPDQDAHLSRSFNLSYYGNPRMSAVLIAAQNDNRMWSQVKIYGVHDAEDYTLSGGDGYSMWYIKYDPDEGTYMVKKENAGISAVLLRNVYPTRVEIEGYTTWSSFSPRFRMAIVGGNVSWYNVQESPSPGDDGNPPPMMCIIQPGVNVLEGR